MPYRPKGPSSITRERLIDGHEPEPARMVAFALLGPGCPPGKHCTAHGEEPYVCCKCGAKFEHFATSEGKENP